MFGIKKDIAIHFIGIGGIGMSGIAEILISMEYEVSGSDISRNNNVIKLEGLGAKIYIGHNEKNIENAQLVVYSSAIDDKNPEIKYAKENSIPIIKRAEMLSELMRLKYGIAIAGSHGKTTTSSLVSTIFKKMNLEPTCIIGGIVKNLGGHAVNGKGEHLIAEADESDGSFLSLNPIMSIITNIDNDHLDFYKTEENIQKAFIEFANKIPFYGCVAINIDDPNSVNIIEKLRRRHVGFGIITDKENADLSIYDYAASELEFDEKGSRFTLHYKGLVKKIFIKLSGKHNVYNALSAIAISHEVGLDLDEVCKAIEEFDGVSRRFEMLYNNADFTVIDDYGHHPTEVRATINTAKVKYRNRKLITIFEPHRYTRTKDFWNEFVECFRNVDEVYIAPIYAASEEPINGIDAETLIESINTKFNNAKFLANWSELKNLFELEKDNKTVILSLGAGSISKQTREQIEQWKV